VLGEAEDAAPAGDDELGGGGKQPSPNHLPHPAGVVVER
jgi:hypothetical protein